MYPFGHVLWITLLALRTNTMISLEQLREVEPALKDMFDKEVERIRDLLYAQAKMALECFLEEKTGTKQEVHVPDFSFDSRERDALKRCQEIMDLKKKK